MEGKTYAELMTTKLGVDKGVDLKAKVAEVLNIPGTHFIISNMEWLGLFSDKKVRVVSPLLMHM